MNFKMNKLTKFKPVIGLEIHVELKTKSKMFCQCEADYFGKEPNTNTCPVCLGLPGALPVPNRKAVERTILIGKALDCKINKISKFDRKHYFYPDLPKGYQISQYDEPIAVKGKLSIFNNQYSNQSQNSNSEFDKNFRITRVHLEEDTGKLLHVGSDTLVDFNRSGVPLVEIVTEPDFDNSDDVKVFLEELQTIIRYLGVSDADMEKGTMRIEPNVSLIKLNLLQLKNVKRVPGNPKGSVKLPKYKVEVKNINSFRFVKDAIDYELERQIALLEKGITPKQETRGYDPDKKITFGQRSKEEAHDYRYFPEPDIPPMTFSEKFIAEIKVPELPQERLDRYINKFGLREQDAFVITRSLQTTNYFETIITDKVVQEFKAKKKISNLEDHVAKIIINKKLSTDLQVRAFIKKTLEMLQPKETDEKLLNALIDRLIEASSKAVEDYKKGKENAIMYLVGQVMREMKGKADAKIIISKLKAQISNPQLKSKN